MENWIYVFGGAIGSIGAFWIIISYVLKKLDSKVDVDVFKEFGKRVSDNLDAGKRRFDKIDDGLDASTTAINQLCQEFGEFKGVMKILITEIQKDK